MNAKQMVICVGVLIVLFFPLFTVAQQPGLPLVNDADHFIGVLNGSGNGVNGPQLPFGSINPSPQTVKSTPNGY